MRYVMSAVLLMGFCMQLVSAETVEWTEKQLCRYIESGYMKETWVWQITSFASYNERNKEIVITSDTANAIIEYKLSIPMAYYDRCTVSILSVDRGDWRDPKNRVRSENLKITQNQDEHTYDFTFFCAKKYQNASCVYLDGWKDGMQRPFRMWLCGFNDAERAPIAILELMQNSSL